MTLVELFEHWAMPYTSHRQSCSEQCQPNSPNCVDGYKIARRCISLGPIAWLKKNHENSCPTCHSGGFLCNEGRRLWKERVDAFVVFLNKNCVTKK